MHRLFHAKCIDYSMPIRLLCSCIIAKLFSKRVFFILILNKIEATTTTKLVSSNNQSAHNYNRLRQSARMNQFRKSLLIFLFFKVHLKEIINLCKVITSSATARNPPWHWGRLYSTKTKLDKLLQQFLIHGPNF